MTRETAAERAAADLVAAERIGAAAEALQVAITAAERRGLLVQYNFTNYSQHFGSFTAYRTFKTGTRTDILHRQLKPLTPPVELPARFKVYAGTFIQGGHQFGVFIAARSKKQAAHAAGVSLHEVNTYWSETWNTREIDAAAKQPLVLMRWDDMRAKDGETPRPVKVAA